MNIQNLKKEQVKLAKKVVIKDDFDEIKYIAGCDQAVIGDEILSAVVVIDADTLSVVEKKYAVAKAPINYIPGFLSYRESPAIVEAFSKLKQKPDLLFVDANGILHPRRIGMASHLGILLDVPTIGIAKKLLLGEVVDGKIMVEGDVRGMEVSTKEHAKPLYVSPGHRISVKTAAALAKKFHVEKHKMPEPLHEAHKYSKKIKMRLDESKSEGDD